MKLFQSSICGICKQEFAKVDHQNSIISCTECEAPYHKNHLKIWLQLEENCPLCRQDLQKLAFVTYSIKYERLNVSGELFYQLEKIFPRGVPKPILKRYIQEYPTGMPQDKFEMIKDKHSRSKISKNERRRINVMKREEFVYKNLRSEILSSIVAFIIFISMLMLIGYLAGW